MEPVSPAFCWQILNHLTTSKALFWETLVLNYFDASDALAQPGVVQGAMPPGDWDLSVTEVNIPFWLAEVLGHKPN